MLDKFKKIIKVGLEHNINEREQYCDVIGYVKSKSGLVGEVTVVVEFDVNEWNKKTLIENINIDESYSNK